MDSILMNFVFTQNHDEQTKKKKNKREKNISLIAIRIGGGEEKAIKMNDNCNHLNL